MSRGVDAAGLREERDRLAREHGPWGDDVFLADGLRTIEGEPGGAWMRTKALVQVVADALGGDLAGVRVLDLGAAEGRHTVEFARHGAEAVALEGRAGNVAKARFLKEALGLEGMDVVLSDVRELSAATHGEFDAVLCLGLLYHLEAEAVVDVVRRIAEVTRRVAVFDTHVSDRPRAEVTAGGRTLHGRLMREFDPGASAEEQAMLNRSSIANPESFWPTRASLFNLLADSGFTSVLEVQVPRVPRTSDRITLVCFRGEEREVLSAPSVPVRVTWPEREKKRVNPNASWRGELKKRLAPFTPAPVKEWSRRRRLERQRRR